MIYNLVNGTEVVRRLTNDHGIRISEDLPRIPKWIYQALQKLRLLQGWVPSSYFTKVTDGMAILPEDMQQLIAVEYNGIKLSRKAFKENMSYYNNNLPVIQDSTLGVTIKGRVEDITIDDNLNIELTLLHKRAYDHSTIRNTSASNDYYYVLLNNRKIECNIEDGYIWIHYYKFPYEYDDDHGINLPFVPENEEVIEYITSYIMLCMLQRGYKHPTYNLESNNEFTNVGLKLKKQYIPAKNSANAWDKDKSTRIANIWNSAFYNQISNVE
jgi:hypothetical protein